MKKPPKPHKAKRKPDPNLPDDEAIRRLFPKRVVDAVNEDIGHKPQPKPPAKSE